MVKRIVAGVLWFFCGWYFGAFVAFAFGIPALLAPIIAIGATALVVADPLKVIWNRSATEATRRVTLHRLEEATTAR